MPEAVLIVTLDRAAIHHLKEQDRIGFFGKLPAHGDFVGWGLSADLQRLLQDWLQAGLQAARERHGEAWQRTFKSMPPWRFLIEEGLWSNHAIAGVLIPSEDRVGRGFPLVLLSQIQQSGEHPFRFYKDETWFTALEAIAETGLRRDFQLESFTAALQRLRRIRPVDDSEMETAKGHRSRRESLWWTVAPGTRDVQGFRNEGPPRKDDFVRLFPPAPAEAEAVCAKHSPLAPSEPQPHLQRVGLPVMLEATRPRLSAWSHAFETHAGTRGRVNADALLASGAAGLFAVADGAADSSSSAEAAKLAVHLAGQAVMEGSFEQRLREVRGKLGRANTLLRSRMDHPAAPSADVASVAVLMLQASAFAALWAGDARCYLLRDGMLRCLTRDHVQIGMRRSLSRAVGLETTFQPDTIVDQLQLHDTFLLCTAPVMRALSERVVAEIMLSEKASDVPRTLVENALIAGCADNMTILAVHVHEI
ncbi:type VI secretion system-associated protein TagF [Rhizobium helianthi]|uniref:Type VI secretion system-associated protein TagF n=1 Tax=Rhizobium helianthi TaxID=1132695 RepID=A0ABW4M486_9HYPH